MTPSRSQHGKRGGGRAAFAFIYFNNNNPPSAELVLAMPASKGTVPTHHLANKYASFPPGSARSSFAPARSTTPASSGTGEQYLYTPPLINTQAK